MSESTHFFPEMSNSREEIACLFPEISKSTVESAHLFREISSSMKESARLSRGMDCRLYIATEEGNVHALGDLIAAEKESVDAHNDLTAAEEGNVDALNDVVEGRVNIFQEFTGLGNSVLHIAASRGNLQFIEKLLQLANKDLDARHEFVRAKNSDGNTALHLAAFYGHHKLVEKLVGLMEGDPEAGNFLRLQNRKGNTALHEAANGGNYKVVEVLLKHGHHHDLTSVSNGEGETAVFIASQTGHTDIVERLLPLMDSNSNMKRNDGQTPLHSAVFYRHTGIVKKLLQHRPDLAKQTDRCGRTAMHMLVLSLPIRGFMGLYWTSPCKIAGLLLKKDNSLCYKQDNRKQTPLHMAVEWERYDLVDILLKYGRDCIETVDNEGRKPLQLAVINTARVTRTVNILEIYEFKFMLLSLMSRESLSHRDNAGQTALHIALANVKKDEALYGSIIDMLIANGGLVTSEILEYTRKMKRSPTKVWIKAENVSINAVLIATVSFAAAFTLPGGLVSQPGEKPKAVFINAVLFKLFLICDTFSFCTSITSAILVQHAEHGDQQDRPQVLFSVRLLWSALISLVVAFGAAIHMVITPSPWLAGIVWTLVSLVPISVCVARVRSKIFLSVPEMHKIWCALEYLWLTIGWIILGMLDVLNVFLFGGPFYMICWIRKTSQMATLRKRIYRD